MIYLLSIDSIECLSCKVVWEDFQWTYLDVLEKFIFLNAAARTKNYSGAELEGVVKSAVSFALNRQLSMDDLTKPVDEESIKVTMEDFLNALQEIIPAFGASTDDLERCRYGYNNFAVLQADKCYVHLHYINTLIQAY